MKAVIQRVIKGALYVEKEHRGDIGKGLVVLVAFEQGDTEKDCAYIAGKIISLRIFENCLGKMDYSLTDIKGDIMVVSQFTLCGNCTRGNRPDFTKAESADKAEVLYNKFMDIIRQSATGKAVQGVFGKYMLVEIHNDGPVTILLNSR